MKKAQAHKAQIRQEGADDSTQRISRVRKLPLAAWIAAGISGNIDLLVLVIKVFLDNKLIQFRKQFFFESDNGLWRI